MELLIALVIGGLAGWLASIIVGKNGEMGIVLNVVAGILGALLFNIIAGALFGWSTDITQFSLGSFLGALVGAIAVIWIFNAVNSKRRR